MGVNARIGELAQVDELTSVLSRRYIMRALNDEISRAPRSGAPCSVAIIDLDFFKRINDRYGHPVGDEVLRSLPWQDDEAAKSQARQLRIDEEWLDANASHGMLD